MNTLRPLEALLCVVTALVGLLTLGPFLVERLGLLGIVISEVVLVGLPTVGFLQARGIAPIAALGLSRVGARPLVGGLLAGAGAFWLVALLESTWLERLLPVPPEVKESLKRLVVPESGGRPLLFDVLALAVTPALCEEALFRGLALPSLKPRLGAAGAVILTAIMFAGFHLSLYRFIPTALLGALLGLLRVTSGSLWPAILFHALNNTLVLVLTRLGRDSPPLPSPSNVAGIAGLVAAVVALTGGLVIVRASKQRP